MDSEKSEKKNIFLRLHVGMRTFKTALVVFICLIIYNIVGSLNFFTSFDAFMTCAAGIICLQDSMEKTFQTGLNRIYGTFVGALLGMLILYVDRFVDNDLIQIISVPIGIVILIMICNRLKINDSIVIGCVIFLVIALEQTREAPYISSIRRLFDTVVGIVIAIVVNHFIINPDKRNTEDDTS